MYKWLKWLHYDSWYIIISPHDHKELFTIENKQSPPHNVNWYIIIKHTCINDYNDFITIEKHAKLWYSINKYKYIYIYDYNHFIMIADTLILNTHVL